MKHISAGIKIGVLVLVAAVVGYVTWKQVGEQASGSGGYRLRARFKDASGLPGKSRVVTAGLPVGEIAARRLVGNRAEITVRVKRGTVVWANAAIYKKQSSLLGEYYVEIDPGSEESVEGGQTAKNAVLKDGDEIVNVFESASTDELIRRITNTVPRVDEVLHEVKGLAQDVRKVVNGPVSHMAGELDQAITEDKVLLKSVLERTDRALATIERIALDVEGVTDKKVGRILDNVEDVSRDLKELVAVTKGEISMTGQSVREKLDKVDKTLTSIEKTFQGTSSVVDKIDEEEGTLGKLVNDPQIGENIESITTDIAGFVKTAFGLQTIVGIRTERNVFAETFKTYFMLELQPRADKYYLVEIIDDPRGAVKEEFPFNPATGMLERQTTVESKLRFTFQFAKIIDRFTVRLGIKESTGGVGLDVKLFDKRLTLSGDVFDGSFDDWPRVKLAAAYNFWSFFYVYGAVDDLFNERGEIPVTNPTLTGMTDGYHFGQDVSFGLMLRFNDLDLAALLFIGGSAIAGAAGS